MSDSENDIIQRGLKPPKYEPGQDSTRSRARETFTHADYTVGWICPLQIELIAALEMLDEEHAKLPQQPADHNVYHLGSISGHNVVVAGMWQAGNPTAATVVAQMRMTFPNIRFGLLVGIGGGVPVVTEQGMIRLGHVVVSKPTGQSSGAIQYDRGKAQDGKLVRTGALAPPPPVLLLAADALAAQRARSREDPLVQNIQRFDTTLPGLRCYRFPGNDKDYLFPADYKHLRPRTSCEAAKCDISRRISRDEDGVYKSDQWITVHRGTIASGEVVIKDAAKRDLLSLEDEILCFEMECAGALSDFPCLVIRGISDYCDSHKNDEWHGFAAAAAAAYARQLFFHMPIDQTSLVPAEDPGIKRIVRRSDDEERLKIAEWISSASNTTLQVGFLSQRSEGTGQWLLDTPKFRDWIKEKGMVLFCPGVPGAGKTILASIVVNHLQTSFANQHHIGIAYIFCDYREPSQQSSTSIVASILKQLVQSMESLPEYLTTLYATRQSTRPPLQLNELNKLLNLVVNSYSRVYIVIDALDECPDSGGTRSAVISHILELQEKCNMNVFATSRFLADITARFENFPTIEVRASDADVARYAEGRLNEFSCVRKSPALSQLVVSSITKTCDGMFLLARLYLNSLKGESSPKAVKTALAKFQSGSDAYNDVYQKTMERIEHQIPGQASLAKRLLSWLTFAQRSLTLTELQHALAVEADEAFFDDENLPDVEDMITVCAGLVTYSEDNHIIALVHYTTKEYFEREWDSWFPNAPAELGRTCITYLCYDVFESGCSETLYDYEKRCYRYPFYRYAASNWGHHAYKQPLEHELLLKLMENNGKRSACAQSLAWCLPGFYGDFEGLPTDITALHLTVWFGLVSETESLLKRNHEITAHSEIFGTPMVLAVNEGKEDMVKLLLRYGACPFVLDKSNMTLAAIAASKGHVSLLSLMLRLGVDPELSDASGRTPLSYAAENGYSKAVKVLLDARASIERKDRYYGRTPLAWAVASGHQSTVCLLLEAGARADTKITTEIWPQEAETTIILAVKSGKREIVELLLKEDIDPDEPDGEGRTPLSWAAQEGHPDIVRQLLAAGVSIDRINAQKDRIPGPINLTPLGWATLASQQAVVQLLLENGASPNIFTDEPPLFTAVSNRDVEIVELLLRYGADWDIKTYLQDSNSFVPTTIPNDRRVLRLLVRYSTRQDSPTFHDEVLLLAVSGGHNLLVEVLLEEGADINTKDPQSGDTPLARAAMSEHEGTVAFLIEKGAMIDARDKNGKTVLSNAAGRGALNMVKLLLERGANVASEDIFGQTPLFHALTHRNETVVELLLKKDPTLLHGRDYVGRSPLLIATENRLKTVLQIAGDMREHSEIVAEELAIVLHTISSPSYDLTQCKCDKLYLWAAANGYMEVISHLMGKVMNHSCEDESGATPLSLAARNSQTAVIEFLLKEGVQPNTEDGSGHVPLGWALSTGGESIACLLLLNGADPHKPIKAPLDYYTATHPPLFWAAKRGFERAVKLLLQMGSDPNYFLKRRAASVAIALSQYTLREEIVAVFTAAVKHGNHSIVQALLDRGIKSFLCHTGLIIAMRRNDEPLVSLIVQKGIRNNWLIDEHGQSTLFYAAYYGYVDVVESLLDRGMDADTRSTQNLFELRNPFGDIEETPLFFAAQEGQEGVVRALLGHEANPNVGLSLRRAMDNGHAKVIEAFIQHGAKINLEKHGFSFLSRAAREGHHDLVGFLLRRGVPPEPRNSKKRHLLLQAVSRNQITVVNILLEWGVDVDVVDELGRTGLMLAAGYKQPDMADLFLRHGANASLADNLGRTPLFFAVLRRSMAVAKNLLENGNVDPHRMTCAGRCPLSIAYDSKLQEFVSLLSGRQTDTSDPEEHMIGSPYICRLLCDTCHEAIYNMEYFFQCPICSLDKDKTLNMCLECVAGEIGCYDRLHTLRKAVMIDGKANIVGKTSRWRQNTLPMRPSANVPPEGLST